MARHWKIAIVALTLLAIVGLATLPALLRTVLGLHGGVSEEQARRALSQPLIATPSDTPSSAQLFWISANSPAVLEPAAVEIPLSADSVVRSKQLIAALISQAPTPAQRTLPADAELLQFYLLPDGTGIADFSETLSSETPSGILSEQMAVDSLVRTLGANVSGVHQLKILIRGQETDTLAGHLDLTEAFPVQLLAPAAAAAADNATGVAAGGAAPAGVAPAADGAISAAPAARPQAPAQPQQQAPPAKTIALPLVPGAPAPAGAASSAAYGGGAASGGAASAAPSAKPQPKAP